MSDQKYRVISPKGKWKLATREQIITAREAGKLRDDCEVLISERAESLVSFRSGESSKSKKDGSPTAKQLNPTAELSVVAADGGSRGDVSRLIGEATAKRDGESLAITEHAKPKMESNLKAVDEDSNLTMALSLMDELTIE